MAYCKNVNNITKNLHVRHVWLFIYICFQTHLIEDLTEKMLGRVEGVCVCV